MLISTGGGVGTPRGGGGLSPGWSGGGGRGSTLVFQSPASEKRGIRYRWYPCTTSMLRVEDPGSCFMLYLGPGPPSLLHLTRANATKPYAGETHTDILQLKKFHGFFKCLQCQYIGDNWFEA